MTQPGRTRIQLCGAFAVEIGGRNLDELSADAVVDIEMVSESVERAESALQRSDWKAAQVAAEIALRVADGGFLPEIDSAWAAQTRRQLEEARLRALECIAACGLGLGGSHLSATERAARALVAEAPYRETGYFYLMHPSVRPHHL